jgi:uncharacterized protein YutE (UPF0331/DUF86 family)
MKLNGVIARKLSYFQDVLGKVRTNALLTISQLESDWQLRRCLERDLQVLIEIVSDICLRIVSISGAGPIDSAENAITKCVELGILANEEPYRRMVKFRNLIVHAYGEVDLSVLTTVINQHLDDFQLFYDEVFPHVQV